MCFCLQDTLFYRRRVKNHPEHRRLKERSREMSRSAPVTHEFRWSWRAERGPRRRQVAKNDKRAKSTSRLCSSYVVHSPRELTNHRQSCVRQGGARGFELPVRNSVHTEIHVWILQTQILFIAVQRIKPLSRFKISLFKAWIMKQFLA